MTLRTASRQRFGSRCFFASVVLPLACLDTVACSESGAPQSGPIDGGGAVDAAERPDAGNAQDAHSPPASIEAGHAGSEAATTPDPDAEAGNAGEAGDADGAVDAGDTSRPGALGAACSDSAGCQSGHCSESVCCDTECDRLSEACNRPGSEGACTFTPVLHVDPNTGDDSFKGLESAPLKTLGLAVRAAASVATDAAPWRIVLHDGTYSAATGEQWPVTVRTGIKIEAASTGKAVLIGSPITGALFFEGNISVTGIVAKNFQRAFLAYSGSVAFERVEVDGGSGFMFTNGVVATLKDSNLRNLTGIGVEMKEAAKLTITGGSITADPNAVGCENAVGIQVSTGADLKLDGVFVGGFATSGLVASWAYFSTIASTFDGNGLPACDGAQMQVLDGTVPIINGVKVLNGKARGIELSGISGAADVSITDSELTNNYVGIELHGTRGITMRRTRITDSFVGIYAPSADDQVIVDLGETGSPGNNVIRGSNRALVLLGAYDPILYVHAEGNQWNPGVEGADAEGRYIAARALVRPQHPVGGNFLAPNVKLDI